MSRLFRYKPTATGIAFHNSDAYIKLVDGPYGGGKSTICASDLFYNALAQPPAPDGKRYSRWGVIRATYKMLKETTRNSILEVFPTTDDKDFLNLGGNGPITGLYKLPLPDGTEVRAEFQLVAMGAADHIERFKSANWTGCWINEAESVPYDIFTFVTSRIGRYPPANMGGIRWSGIIADFNRPPVGHYLHNLMDSGVLQVSEDESFAIETFHQPPAAFRRESEDGIVYYEVNDEAENLENLKGGKSYYYNQIALREQAGRTDEIEHLFCMLDVPVRDGKPVFPNFDRRIHVAPHPITPEPNQLTVIGYDTSGIHPAAAFWQKIGNKWCMTDELYGSEMGILDFISVGLLPLLNDRYRGCKAVVSFDPADTRNSWNLVSPARALEEVGIFTDRPPTNKPKERIIAVERLMDRVSGGMMISPHCTMAIGAMSGGYKYRRHKLKGGITDVYSTTPDKDSEDSHIADAIQYAALYIMKHELGGETEYSPIVHRLQAQRHARRAVLR